MEKATRAEHIAALVTDQYSGFVDGDTAMLETASDTRLEDFRAAADARRAAERAKEKLATDLTNANARLKVSEERMKTLNEAPSEEEWMAKAPEEIRTLIQNYKAEQDEKKASIVAILKDLGAHTEVQLKAMPLEQLTTLAQYARVEVPDYSGRGLPSDRKGRTEKSYAPPDPYAEGLKALQAQSKTH